jgi:hypothetical protein
MSVNFTPHRPSCGKASDFSGGQAVATALPPAAEIAAVFAVRYLPLE